MNHDELDGLHSVKKRVREKEILIFHTDKSKKFAVETPGSYIESMQPHLDNKTEIDRKFVSKTVTKLNDVNKSLVKILGIGASSGQTKRAVNNVLTFPETELPVLNGLTKDHKSGNTKRPVVNGNLGPISASSDLASDILEVFLVELREEVEKENTCKSVEELISQFISFNKKVESKTVEKKERFVASIDVKSLYPSLKTDQCEKAVRKIINSSKIKLEGINKKELSVFIRKNLSTNEIREKGLVHLAPIKRKKPKKSEETE